MRKPHVRGLFGICERHSWGALPEALLLGFPRESESRAADVARHQVYHHLHAAARAVGLDSEGFGPHTFRRANITWRQHVGGSAVQAGNIVGTATGATAGDGASRGSSAGRRPPPSLRTPGRLRMTAVDAGTSPVGVCLGNRFPTANIAKTACEPRTTAPRLPDTNNHPGIQSATADLMWPLTGFAIGRIDSRHICDASMADRCGSRQQRSLSAVYVLEEELGTWKPEADTSVPSLIHSRRASTVRSLLS